MESPQPEYVTIGYIRAPWGSGGKLKLETAADFRNHLTPSATVYIDRQPITIDSIQWRHSTAIVKFAGIDSTANAEALAGKPVEIPSGRLQPLPPDKYYHSQLIGLRVQTSGGEVLGAITEIIANESRNVNDIYVVSGEEGEVLVPAIADVVKSIDLAKQVMVIEPIKGLLELNRKAD